MHLKPFDVRPQIRSEQRSQLVRILKVVDLKLWDCVPRATSPTAAIIVSASTWQVRSLEEWGRISSCENRSAWIACQN